MIITKGAAMLLKILYVEDNDDIREVTSDLLAKYGYNLTPVTNGIEALEAFKQRKFDLIITDIFMPEMDGNQLIEALAAYPNLPPILALSYNIFDIFSNPVITVVGIKPLVFQDFQELVHKALY